METTEPGTAATTTGAGEDDFVHSVSRLEWLIGDVLRLRTPRALCGASLEGGPNEPGPAAPPCPACELLL